MRTLEVYETAATMDSSSGNRNGRAAADAKARRLFELANALVLLCLALLGPGAAAASEAAIKQAMQKMFPNLPVQSVARTPVPGIYEVFAGGEIFYVDEKVNFMFVEGKLVDTARRADVTEERLRVLTAVKFDQIPLELAFPVVRGNGKRRMAYFTDPNCTYCKRLDQELAKINDVTIYVFLYPILSQGSRDKATAVWCSKDRAKAYNDMMLNGVTPAMATCDTPIEKILAFGRQQAIRATPTLFFADGQRKMGALSADQLNTLLGR